LPYALALVDDSVGAGCVHHPNSAIMFDDERMHAGKALVGDSEAAPLVATDQESATDFSGMNRKGALLQARG
jgi:hypothetical protein